MKARIVFSLLYGWFYANLYSVLNNVSIGKKVKFYGRPVLQRYPNSSITIGDRCRFRSDFTIAIGYKKKTIIRSRTKGAKIHIGNDCGFNACIISARESITIGNNVKLGYNTRIIDYDGHSVYDHNKKGNVKPVVIEDGVFVGMNVNILKGVTIGQNSVIGANSVVSKSIPSNVIAVGNPCNVVKILKD